MALRVTVECMDLDPDVQRFLTEVRGRLSPEEAGVPIFGGERQVRGLRREEVAQLPGVSTAYYTRMERGNLRGVSEGVLRSLARTLQMNSADRTPVQHRPSGLGWPENGPEQATVAVAPPGGAADRCHARCSRRRAWPPG